MNWHTYKRQRNNCTLLRKAIINYYHHKAESIYTKPKEFWKFFGALFHSKRGQANDSVLLENNEYITDRKRVANIFYEYFINIANDLPTRDRSQYGLNVSDHPYVQTSQPWVYLRTVHSLSSSKVMGWDNIPIGIIKDRIDSIA